MIFTMVSPTLELNAGQPSYTVDSYSNNSYDTPKDEFIQNETVYGKGSSSNYYYLRIGYYDPNDTFKYECTSTITGYEITCDYQLPSDALPGQWKIKFAAKPSDPASWNANDTKETAYFNVTATPPTDECTINDYEYTEWSACENYTQTREFVLKESATCDVPYIPEQGELEPLEQSCGITDPVDCTINDYEYTEWSACVNDIKTRILLSQNECVGGVDPILTTTCNTCDLDDYTYSDWGECIDGVQHRTWSWNISSYIACEDGYIPQESDLLQSCNPELPDCTSEDYSEPTSWGECIEGSQSGIGTKQNECNGPETWTFTQSCQVELPDCTEDDYTIGDWGACLSTGMRYRTVTLNEDSECVVPEVQPATSEQCTYTPPSGGGGGGGYPFWLFETSTNPVVPQVLGEKIGGIRYVKSPDISTVFLVDEDNVRNPYPHYHVWESYFGNDYSSVEIISQNNILQYLLGKNIFFKIGSLMKITSDTKVYQVAENGILHWIKSEETAKRLFGDNWAKLVYDLPEVFFGDYTIGDPIE